MGKYISRFGILLIFPFVALLYVVEFNGDPGDNENFDSTTTLQEENEKQYLVNSSKCRIPDLDPWNSDARRFANQNYYVPCTTKKLLTYVVNNGTVATLHVDKEAEALYSTVGVICCYSYVNRGDGELPDADIRLSPCLQFGDNATLSQHTIIVRCYNKQSEQEVYSNAHSFTLLTDEVLKKARALRKKFNPPSILFVGIDSVSRLNFHRSLPKTRDFLENNDWIEYKGYNKVDDNTFPNLMAIFTGRNFKSVEANCNPYKQLGVLDKCNFIWKDYKDHGYVTAYAEDEASINTFTYLKKGFQNPPTDVYFRPYVQASETLVKKRLDQMTYCTGPENSGERILNVAKDFAVTSKGLPSFGIFWTSSISHNRINAVSRMDGKLVEFLEDLAAAGILNNTIVIFWSDHGLRFGNIRLTRTGWLEERLPFLYFSIPQRFRKKFAKEYKNLKLNSKRLTSPYDLHMTLQDVLVLSGMNFSASPSQACPNCKTLFKEAEEERSCEEAAIEMHWCTCTGYRYLNPNSDLALRATQFVVDEINHRISTSYDSLRKCVKLKPNKVISSSLSDSSGSWYKNDTYLLLMFKTIPETILEATISVAYENAAPKFKLQGSISRLDYYKFNSECLKTWPTKMYCYCRWNQFLDMNFFSFWFEV